MPALPATALVDLPNWLGDVVLALPAVARLAAANRAGRTDLLLPAGLVPLAALAGAGALVRPSDAGVRWARRSLAGYDVALTTRHSTRAKALLAATGARTRLASRGRGARLLGLRTFEVDRGRHQRHDFDAALAHLGVDPVADDPFRLAVAGTLAAEGSALRRRRAPARPLVALFPAVRAAAAKRYPAAGFRALAAALRDAGVASVAVVGPGEDELAFAVAADGVLEPLPLDRVAAFLAACDAAVGNDSGLTHLAAAAGCPTLALFGPTDPARTAPAGARVLLAPHGRLDLLPPAEVAHAALDLLVPGADRATPPSQVW